MSYIKENGNTWAENWNNHSCEAFDFTTIFNSNFLDINNFWIRKEISLVYIIFVGLLKNLSSFINFATLKTEKHLVKIIHSDRFAGVDNLKNPIWMLWIMAAAIKINLFISD